MSKNIYIISAIVIILLLILYGLNRQPVQPNPKKIFNQEIPLDNNSEKILLKIPTIEYEVPGNKLTNPIITGYTDMTVEEGDEFIIEPESLGFMFGNSVAEVKIKLIEVEGNSVAIDVLADKGFNGDFFPRDPIERVTIQDETCISAFQFVMDVSYDYCFNVENINNTVSLKYSIQSRSTMPKP